MERNKYGEVIIDKNIKFNRKLADYDTKYASTVSSRQSTERGYTIETSLFHLLKLLHYPTISKGEQASQL